MSEPIEKKTDIKDAPTPQNTPASNVGSLVSKSVDPKVPKTISEENEENLKKFAGNPAIAALIEEKLNTLIGADSGYVDSFPEVVKNRIISLKSIQKKQMDLEAEFQKELFALEKKYNEKAQPLNKHRMKIITGEVEPTEEEIEEGKAIEADLEGDDENANHEEPEMEEGSDEKKEKKTEEKEESSADKIVGIPSFWLTAMGNLEPLSETITADDSKILEHLVDIRLQHLENPGFKLIFEFSPNEYFSDKTLEKTYYYQKELGYTGDFIYDHAEGCEISWKSPDKNPTIRIERRKQRNKHTKQTRTIEKLSPTESFFNFFDPPKPPKVDDEDEDEDEDEDQEELEARLQLDYSIAEEIKDKLIPRAVDWFTGTAMDFLDYEGMDEFDDDSEDEEFGDDDDDDDEDDDEEHTKGLTQKDPQECKQQ